MKLFFILTLTKDHGCKMTLTTDLGSICRGTELGNHFVHCTQIFTCHWRCFTSRSSTCPAVDPLQLGGGRSTQRGNLLWGVMNMWVMHRKILFQYPNSYPCALSHKTTGALSFLQTQLNPAWPAEQHTDARADLA